MTKLPGNYLDFEKPVRDLENQISELKQVGNDKGIDISKEIMSLEEKASSLIGDIYNNLGQWERVQLSRHPDRPHTKDYIAQLIDKFHDVSGDRYFADDPAVIAGFGFLDGQKVAVIGIEKGRKTKEKVIHNFGMPRPEGYRKALRVMQLAGQFRIPIISFVDTPGAYPGIDAEERGQAQAIAQNLAEMFDIKSPIVAVVIGEGGSGGALGIAIADKVYMQEYSVYSVISPESCASILWSDPKKAEVAANSLKLGPSKALELGVVDGIISEPSGGAHRNPVKAALEIKKVLKNDISELMKWDCTQLLKRRFDKFRTQGNSTIAEV